MSTIKLENIQTRTGSGTITIGASGETVALPEGATLSDNILFDTASKGIYLGVTTATASNLLDDYEEGTWTPVLKGSTAAGSYTYAIQGGRYTKIGRFVTVHCELFNITTVSAGSGQARISGLPFTVAAGQDEYVGICRLDSFSFAGSYVTADALVTADEIVFREMISGSPDTLMSVTDKVNDNADIQCTISYITT